MEDEKRRSILSSVDAEERGTHIDALDGEKGLAELCDFAADGLGHFQALVLLACVHRAPPEYLQLALHCHQIIRKLQ